MYNILNLIINFKTFLTYYNASPSLNQVRWVVIRMLITLTTAEVSYVHLSLTMKCTMKYAKLKNKTFLTYYSDSPSLNQERERWLVLRMMIALATDEVSYVHLAK